MGKTNPTSYRLSPNCRDRIAWLSANKGVSAAAIVELAVAEYYEREVARAAKLERAKEIVDSGANAEATEVRGRVPD